MMRSNLVIASAFFVLAVAAFAPTATNATLVKGWKDCANTSDWQGVIKSIDVVPCPSEPCKFPQGTDVKLTVTFVPKKSSKTLKGVVTALLAGITAPFPLPNPDACRSVGCPTEAGDTLTYSETLPIEPLYPKVTVTVSWKLIEENNQGVWCFSMPATVV